MSLDDVKNYFQRLKEACKIIEQNVNEAKKNVQDRPGNEELACKLIFKNQDKIETLKKETNELKFDVDTQVAHTSEFIQLLKELLTDTEIAIARHENYLKEYGYKPCKFLNITLPTVEEEASVPVDNAIVSPVKDKFIKDETPRTPNLLDYGIVSGSTLKFETEHSNVTPTLDEITTVDISPIKNSNITPTLDVTNVNMNDKESPPKGSFASHVPDFPSTPTLEL